MEANYWLLIIVTATMLFKAIANSTNYWYNKIRRDALRESYNKELSQEEQLLIIKKGNKQARIYGVLYHIFEVFMMLTPTLIAPLVFGMLWGNYLLGMLGASLVYFGFFNNLYNRMIKRHPAFLGTTDIVDRFLRWAFCIDKDPDNPAKNKNLVLWIRAGLGMFGAAIIIEFVVF